jgi:hypothetical protein
MVNPHTNFLNVLSGLRHVLLLPPPLWHFLWSDNFGEGNMTHSQSEGAVRGDRHGPLQ